jgi:hypothetical protein
LPKSEVNILRRLPDIIALFLIVLSLLSVLLPFSSSIFPLDGLELSLVEKIRELSISDSYFHYTYNFSPDYSQPPLILWLGKLSLSFTDNLYMAARLPSIAVSIFFLLSIYKIASNYFDDKVAFWWILLLLATPISFLLLRSASSFGVGFAFSFLAIYRLQRATFNENVSSSNFLAAAIYTGLASLSMGFVAIIICFSNYLLYWVNERFNVKDKLNDVLMYFVLSVIFFAIWPLSIFLDAGYTIFYKWIDSLFLTYHYGLKFTAIALLITIASFPMNVLSVSVRNIRTNNSMNQRHFIKWINQYMLVVAIYALVDYRSLYLLMVPMSFLAAFAIVFYLKESFYWPIALNSIFLFIGGGVVTSFLIIAWLPSFKNELSNITQSHVLSNCLDPLNNSYLGKIITVILGVVLLISCFLLMKRQIYNGLILFCTSLFMFNAAYIGSTFKYIKNSYDSPIKHFCEKVKSPQSTIISYNDFCTDKILLYAEATLPVKTLFEIDQTNKSQFMIARIDDEKNTDIYLKKFKKIYKDGGYVFYQYIPTLTK